MEAKVTEEKSKIKVTIVTPEEKVFDGWVDFISIPGQSGSLGVYPRHIPIIVQLKTGIVKLVDTKETIYIGVCRGFFEFINNKANILTEQAIRTTQENIAKTCEILKQKYNITHEITEETRKVIQAIASLKSLEK
ncbi:MAG: ATP synthase F1 subunit epsilon [Actinobacteria bacterium]|nr:ATP synthase F1 subunit epsilon [Actinomycetota bacterium]